MFCPWKNPVCAAGESGGQGICGILQDMERAVCKIIGKRLQQVQGKMSI